MKSQKMKIIGIMLLVTLVVPSVIFAMEINKYKAEFGVLSNTPFGENCPQISQEELAAGWYYGDLDQKKPGTPDTWGPC